MMCVPNCRLSIRSNFFPASILVPQIFETIHSLKLNNKDPPPGWYVDYSAASPSPWSSCRLCTACWPGPNQPPWRGSAWPSPWGAATTGRTTSCSTGIIIFKNFYGLRNCILYRVPNVNNSRHPWHDTFWYNTSPTTYYKCERGVIYTYMSGIPMSSFLKR
jgi:hypothetical protein